MLNFIPRFGAAGVWLFLASVLDDHDRHPGQAHYLFCLGAQQHVRQTGAPLAAHYNHACIDLFGGFEYSRDRYADEQQGFRVLQCTNAGVLRITSYNVCYTKLLRIGEDDDT